MQDVAAAMKRVFQYLQLDENCLGILGSFLDKAQNIWLISLELPGQATRYFWVPTNPDFQVREITSQQMEELQGVVTTSNAPNPYAEQGFTATSQIYG